METIELRSKEEIAREIENNRREVSSAFRDTKHSVKTRNPAALAWGASKRTYLQAKDVTVSKLQAADDTVRENIYRGIGIALLAGAITGIIIALKTRKNKRCR